VDIETRRQKQQELMVRIVERKVRERAQQLYDRRGRKEGDALKDWFQAESEVLENNIVGLLYRRLKTEQHPEQEGSSSFASSNNSSRATTL
jgi:Protein of unknown function (DUF2934)